jgi:hypothetical protein
MGHCVQAIIAPAETADAISASWPELPRLDRGSGFVVFPVDADIIDSRIEPDKIPAKTAAKFKLLTDGFRKLLQALSRNGQLAYVETDYFGGIGGQGALVCRNGEEIMPPTWDKRGPVNHALKLIGMPRGLFTDRFTAAGFDRLRDNDDILDLIAAQTTNDT